MDVFTTPDAGGRLARLRVECRNLGMSLANLQLRMREDGIDDSMLESAVFCSDVARLRAACESFVASSREGFEPS